MNMLNKKIKCNRIKPKAKKLPQYLKWLHEVKMPECFVCGSFLGVQMHHIKRSSSDYRDDTKIIPLCHEHHLGVTFSAHGTPKDFRDEYPIYMQLEYGEVLYQEFKRIGI